MKKPDKQARFTALYQSYIDEIYAFISARSGHNAATAEDITQDIFVDICKGLDNFKRLCSERTWIYRIARNKLNDFYRKQYKMDIQELDENIIDPAPDIETVFEGRFIRACLDALPLRYRLVLIMKYLDDQSVRQIADIIERTPKATESLLQRARAAFIEEYREANHEKK